MTLAIINREPYSGSIPPGVLVWRTCLREVLLAPSAEPLLSAAGRTLIDGRAYRLMLEILCGLQSPMIGETQVVAQFRHFLADLPQEQAWIRRIGQRLLADSRRVRAAHLQRPGAPSYGSAVRGCLGSSELVAVVGTGKLAAAILPHVARAGRPVDQWGRAAVATVRPGVRYRPLASLESCAAGETPASLVVAAPAPSPTLVHVARAYRGLLRVIDLRADAGADPLLLTVPLVTLSDLLAHAGEASRFLAAQVEAARTEIDACGCRYEQRDEVRPFGWDDLCA